jgi:hypothetical protein
MIAAEASNGTSIAFADRVPFNSSPSSAPSVLADYADRIWMNAGYDTAATYTTIHNMDTYDGDGTWVGSNDATTVATDASTYKEGSGSVSFTIDVSNSTANKATLTNSTFTAVDLSGEQIDDGAIIFWAYLTDASDIRSFEVRFGSDSSNYYAVRGYEVDAQGVKYTDGWNRIFIPCRNKQTVGSPDMSAVDYLQVNIAFDSGEADQASCRLDGIQFVDKYIRYWYSRKHTDMSGDSEDSPVPNEYEWVFEKYAQSKCWAMISGYEQKSQFCLDEARRGRNEMIGELMYNMPRAFNPPPR